MQDCKNSSHSYLPPQLSASLLLWMRWNRSAWQWNGTDWQWRTTQWHLPSTICKRPSSFVDICPVTSFVDNKLTNKQHFFWWGFPYSPYEWRHRNLFSQPLWTFFNLKLYLICVNSANHVSKLFSHSQLSQKTNFSRLAMFPRHDSQLPMISIFQTGFLIKSQIWLSYEKY